MDVNNNPNVMPNGEEPGKGKAIASLVLGIIGIIWGIYSITVAASLFR